MALAVVEIVILDAESLKSATDTPAESIATVALVHPGLMQELESKYTLEVAAGKFAGVCAIAAESPLAAEFGRRVNDANVLCMGESLVAPDVGCRIVQCFLETKFQDAPAIPERVRAFWAEARDEIRAKGVAARDRNLETLP